MSSCLSRLALAFTLCFGVVSVAAPSPAEAAQTCGKKKKKKKAKAAPSKKVTADTLIKWRKSGMTDDEIVAKAQEAGYVLTAKDKAKLKKAKARTLIAALSPADEEETEVAETSSPKPIDISRTIDPNDIDFDSVAPPSGIPKQHTTASAQRAPEKKKLDTSLRPAAPFDEEAQKKTATAQAKPAQKKQASQPVAEAAPTKRVVYTAADQ